MEGFDVATASRYHVMSASRILIALDGEADEDDDQVTNGNFDGKAGGTRVLCVLAKLMSSLGGYSWCSGSDYGRNSGPVEFIFAN